MPFRIVGYSFGKQEPADHSAAGSVGRVILQFAMNGRRIYASFPSTYFTHPIQLSSSVDALE